MLYPIKEYQTNKEYVPMLFEYWISHERKILMFSSVESFEHIIFRTKDEQMDSVMIYASRGYRVG